MDSSIWAPRSQTSGHPEIIDSHSFIEETIGHWVKNMSPLMAQGPPPIHNALARHKLCHGIAVEVRPPIPTHTRAHACRKGLQHSKYSVKHICSVLSTLERKNTANNVFKWPSSQNLSAIPNRELDRDPLSTAAGLAKPHGYSICYIVCSM